MALHFTTDELAGRRAKACTAMAEAGLDGLLDRKIAPGTRNAAREPMNQLVLYEDWPRAWEAWDIDAEYEGCGDPIIDPAERVEVWYWRTPDSSLRARWLKPLRSRACFRVSAMSWIA